MNSIIQPQPGSLSKSKNYDCVLFLNGVLMKYVEV